MRDKAEFEEWYETSDPWRFDNSTADKCRTDILLDYFRHASFDRLLDIGCGEGVLTAQLAQYVREVKAFDISETAIGRAKEVFADRGNIDFFQMDLNDIDTLGTERFDVINCSEMLYYLTDQERKSALGKIHALLSENGLFIVNLVVVGRNQNGNYFDHPEAVALLSEKFKVVKIFPSVLGANLSFIKRVALKLTKLMKNHTILKRLTLSSDLAQCYQSGFVCVKK